jgi:hypothetical protein
MTGVVARDTGPDDALEVELGPYRITVASAFGPRILGFRLGDGPELLARLGDSVVIDRPDTGVYRFRGGHRLWASPELPWVSYAPDDEPCQVASGEGFVSVSGPVDRAGLTKQITVRLDAGRLVVDHALGNAGPETIEAAPWAITQFRLGGTAVVPLGGREDGEGLQADRTLALWPYTDLSDPRLTWRAGAVLIAAVAGGVLKIGSGPSPGRLGYLIDGHLFTKEVPPQGPGTYPDRGAVAQFFINPSFCELESVGAITALAPGDAALHRETWDLTRCEDVEKALEHVMGDAS